MNEQHNAQRHTLLIIVRIALEAFIIALLIVLSILAGNHLMGIFKLIGFRSSMRCLFGACLSRVKLGVFIKYATVPLYVLLRIIVFVTRGRKKGVTQTS